MEESERAPIAIPEDFIADVDKLQWTNTIDEHAPEPSGKLTTIMKEFVAVCYIKGQPFDMMRVRIFINDVGIEWHVDLNTPENRFEVTETTPQRNAKLGDSDFTRIKTALRRMQQTNAPMAIVDVHELVR
ncbi:MAG: hypothetical protein HY457_03360 [Parcubacteria group bacterium]|nr:hypothetical protein [Parcubacteria group bacterium]